MREARFSLRECESPNFNSFFKTHLLKIFFGAIHLLNKRYRGIEPLASVWKTEVLPLYEYRPTIELYQLAWYKVNLNFSADNEVLFH